MALFKSADTKKIKKNSENVKGKDIIHKIITYNIAINKAKIKNKMSRKTAMRNHKKQAKKPRVSGP